MSGFASTDCGLIVPKDEKIVFAEGEKCVFEIKNYKNYAGLNYAYIFNDSVKSRIANESTTYMGSGARYFVFDEVDDPRFTQHTIKNKPILQTKTNGLTAYIGEWVGFVQVASEYKEPNSGYSLNVKCLSAVIGNERHSLQARFCAPHTRKGDAQVERFKKLILKTKTSSAE
ncbi:MULTISPECIES: hypothetical protein [unclassified Cupriavidus]|uniref:hypothetical protein n=1 Tax=unclassified Cupriavidus TaxID=2640874 RepID=UPI00295EE280|nr:hypothetical protein [Cupriavidus sp. TA19]